MLSRLAKRRRQFSLRLLVFSFGYKYRLFNLFIMFRNFSNPPVILFSVPVPSTSKTISAKKQAYMQWPYPCKHITACFTGYHLPHIHNSFHKVSRAASNVGRRTAYLSHTKDYGIKPLLYLFRFLLHLLSPYGYDDR